MQLQILPNFLFDDYKNQIDFSINEKLNLITPSEITSDNFAFFSSVSSVYSSKIEGEEIELDSFLKHKFSAAQFTPNYTQRADDLFDAYSFARNSILNYENLITVHQKITQHILVASSRGKIRQHPEWIINTNGRIVYVAASPKIVEIEMKKLFADIDYLLDQKLTDEQILFFAACIHLVFVKIHPFEDGNGRTARLLEKWFLAHFYKDLAWFVESEKYYFEHLTLYFQHLQLGLEYEQTAYAESLPFLSMLATYLRNKN
ncbi:MAG: Fic family protein [Chitinophagales bacterium]